MSVGVNPAPQRVPIQHYDSCDMKPNLFVIGAMKSGTSSLHDYLQFHPQILMSTPKETGFFDDNPGHQCPEIRHPDGHGRPSLERYLKLFSGAESKTYAGESSTYYTKWPHVSGVAPRLYQFNPDARLVYIVRDPVERAISEYWFSRKRGWESGPPDQLRRASKYWNLSNYPMQVRQYLKYFSQNQLYVMTLEELQRAPAATMGALFTWLGLELPPGHADERYTDRKNTTDAAVQRDGAVVNKLRKVPAFGYAKRVLPVKVREAARHMINGRIDPNSVDMTENIEFLREMFTPFALELEELCGRQFREWRTLWGPGAAIPERPETVPTASPEPHRLPSEAAPLPAR